MTFQILFTGENKKNVLKCCFPRALSINTVASTLMTIFSMHHIAPDKVLFLSPHPPVIWRMVERAYSVTTVCLSIRARDGVSNLHLSFSGGGIHVLWTHF